MKSDKHVRIQFLFKPRHVQVEAWMINNIIFTCESKNHLSLDSTTSLSQPGVNDANTRGQAQVQLLRNQVHLVSMEVGAIVADQA